MSSDVIDNGCELEQLMREQIITRHQNRPRPPKSDGYCTECGSAIPLARLQVNPYVERCIECQQLHETRRRYCARNHY